MENSHYNAQFEILNPSKALSAISNVSNWWTENIKGSTTNTGDTFTVTFGKTYIKLEVRELLTNKIIWSVTDCYKHFVTNKNEWDKTHIAFEITDGKLVFNHYGLEPRLECYDACINGWNHYLFGSLKPLIETGIGNPDRKN